MTPQVIYERSLFFIPPSDRELQILSKDSEYAYLYAMNTNKRFILGEQIIRTNPALLERYNRAFGTSLTPIPLFDVVHKLLPTKPLTESADTVAQSGKQAAIDRLSQEWKLDQLVSNPDIVMGVLSNIKDVFQTAKAAIRGSNIGESDKKGLTAYIQEIEGNDPGPNELIQLMMYLAV